MKTPPSLRGASRRSNPVSNQPWIYSEKVKELFLHPKNYLHGSEQDFAFDAKGTAGNPICGDEMAIYIRVEKSESLLSERLSKRGVHAPTSSRTAATAPCEDRRARERALGNKDSDFTIKDIKWKTYGCASAIASTSALSELAKGKTIEQALAITPKQIENYLGGLPKHKFHCSVLGMEALADAIKNYQDKL